MYTSHVHLFIKLINDRKFLYFKSGLQRKMTIRFFPIYVVFISSKYLKEIKCIDTATFQVKTGNAN